MALASGEVAQSVARGAHVVNTLVYDVEVDMHMCDTGVYVQVCVVEEARTPHHVVLHWVLCAYGTHRVWDAFSSPLGPVGGTEVPAWFHARSSKVSSGFRIISI